MPSFEIIPMQEAELALTLSGARGAQLREYVEIVRQLEPGMAGRVTANEEGDTTAAIRRRLARAAELLNKNIVVNRQENTVYFWHDGDGPAPVRRRRRRAAANDE